MAYRTRIFFTEKQKAEIWDRWQRGETMSSIGRVDIPTHLHQGEHWGEDTGLPVPIEAMPRYCLNMKFVLERVLYGDQR